MQKNLALVLIIVAVFATLLGYSMKGALDTVYENFLQTTTSHALEEGAKPFAYRELKLPAVGQNGQGALADLRVYMARGTGKVYVQIDTQNPILNPDTQMSVKLAIDVAKQVSNRDTSGVNLYYDLESKTEVVGGRSATAALAIATISLLRNESLRPDTLITGTLEPDEQGTIGSVKGILAKAIAAKNAGYARLVVPKGESFDDGTDVARATGMEIVEAETIFDAYNAMKAK